LGTAAYPQLPEDVLNVRTDRLAADDQSICDLGLIEAVHE